MRFASAPEIALKTLKCMLLASLLATVCLQAGAACYTVFDRYSRVVIQDAQPPVDMARPLHETVPQRFPGGLLAPYTRGVVARVSLK